MAKVFWDLPQEGQKLWEASFSAQLTDQAYNTAPVEAVVRAAAYYLRSRYRPQDFGRLRFLEVGCGAGPNLLWLAQKGIRVSGLDLAPTALKLCRESFSRLGLEGRLEGLVEGSAAELPFASGVFDGVIEACVFQHLALKERQRAFAEVGRVLKKGGLFAGYMLDRGHTLFQQRQHQELSQDPGTLLLRDGSSPYYLSNIGLAHFFSPEEYRELLSGFTVVDPCLATYFLPREEARRRGHKVYLQSMWTVYAIK